MSLSFRDFLLRVVEKDHYNKHNYVKHSDISGETSVFIENSSRENYPHAVRSFHPIITEMT